jgi:hypothetical protein
MSGATVTVASKLDHAVLMQGPQGGDGVKIEQTIVGNRDPGAINGWGMTYYVDADLFAGWMAANPLFAGLITEASQEQIDAASDPMKTHGYEVGLVEPEPPEPPVTDPPVNRDVPYVGQTGATLNCTMGNWDNVPTGYSYLWRFDGVDRPPALATGDYAVQPGDVGLTADCVVTATNAIGSTTAPPSNSVVVS